MNARQLKKRNKQRIYIGIAAGIINKMCNVRELPIHFTLKITPPVIGHNQHGFSGLVKFGKEIYKRFVI